MRIGRQLGKINNVLQFITPLMTYKEFTEYFSDTLPLIPQYDSAFRKYINMRIKNEKSS
jgi:hypothetical protein